jgi:putative ABC transport system permease protein
MRRTIEIIVSSFKMAMQELWKNKLRTFLSLFGITIGIFCIIGVLATVNSLEHNIQNEIKSLGTNTIYIDKWDYSAGNGTQYPWWRYVKRPEPKYEEMRQIIERTPSAKYAAFNISGNDAVEFRDVSLGGVNLYGISEQFNSIQPIEISYGRYITESEFDHGTAVMVIGNDIAEKIFLTAERAVNKEVNAKGKKIKIIGVIKKQGKSMIGGWQFDASVLMPYKFARNIMLEKNSSPIIMVQGRDNLTSVALKDDLKGAMRAIHKLTPTEEDNFSLNDVNEFSEAISKLFGPLNMGGWVIAILSLVVGAFGVMNIMFVSVKERTGQIGLKKAVGAKNRVILAEFLLESAFLCIVGGLMGLTLVFLLTMILTGLLDFPVFISTSNMVLAISISVIVGIVAGIIPAYRAAKMDPVAAIRSK